MRLVEWQNAQMEWKIKFLESTSQVCEELKLTMCARQCGSGERQQALLLTMRDLGRRLGPEVSVAKPWFQLTTSFPKITETPGSQIS